MSLTVDECRGVGLADCTAETCGRTELDPDGRDHEFMVSLDDTTGVAFHTSVEDGRTVPSIRENQVKHEGCVPSLGLVCVAMDRLVTEERIRDEEVVLRAEIQQAGACWIAGSGIGERTENRFVMTSNGSGVSVEVAKDEQ